jgi:hypothetical protein
MLMIAVDLPTLAKVIDSISNLISVAGKGPLYLSAFFLLAIVVTADRWILPKGRNVSSRSRLLVWLTEIATVVFLVLVFLNPSTKKKHCSGTTVQVFRPLDPGIIQPGALSPFAVLRYSWQAPSTVVRVNCQPGKSTYLLGQGPVPENPTIAECKLKTDGGNDPITMEVVWDGDCPDTSSFFSQIVNFFKGSDKAP